MKETLSQLEEIDVVPEYFFKRKIVNAKEDQKYISKIKWLFLLEVGKVKSFRGFKP